MIYTLFFSRFREMGEAERAEYASWSARLVALAETEHPGFVDIKTFTADDGERLTVARFKDAASQESWRRDPVHREGQRLGRSTFYDEYRIVICDEVRSRSWSRAGEAAESEDERVSREGKGYDDEDGHG